MTVNSPETEKRMTPTERLHDIARAMAERPAPVSGQPYFTVKQTKATGGATVWEWDAHVPVCTEYPTAEAAFDAVVSFATRLSLKFPATAINGEPSDKTPVEKQARAAAAIARNRAKAS